MRAIHHQGGRLTSQRQVILAALEALGGHPTAEELFDYVRSQDASINLSTVYRNLRWLEEQGFLNPCWLGDDRGQQRFDPTPLSNHYHFRCLTCGEIVEFTDPLVGEIEKAFASRSQARVESAGRRCQSG